MKSKKPTYVTIRDVAKLADTSIATVSYVLNHPTGIRPISDELRERVVKAAEELGYVRSAIASSLKGSHLGMLAVFVPEFTGPVFGSFSSAISRAAQNNNMIVTFSSSDDNPAKEKELLTLLLSQRMDGCIICPTKAGGKNTEILRKLKIPYVVLARPFYDYTGPYNYVGADNHQAGYLGAMELIKAGHTKVGFIGAKTIFGNVNKRLSGCKAAFQEAGLPILESSIKLIEDEENVAEERRALEELLYDEKITGLIVDYKSIAQIIFKLLGEYQISTPGDLSLVLLNSPDWAPIVSPSLTTVYSHESEGGEAAVQILLDQIETQDSENFQTKIYPCEIIQGQSVGAPRNFPLLRK